MSDVKPNVFPTKEQINEANDTGERIANQLASENNLETSYGSQKEAEAAAEMRKNNEELIRNRDEQLRKQEEIARQMDEKRAKKMEQNRADRTPPPTTPPPTNNNNGNSGDSNEEPNKDNNDAYIESISQPQFNQPFDVIPLPSEGKLYKTKKKGVKVAYLTTADENILTSPNLVESGEFLEILINRKLLEPDLRYKDLVPGDRNAIMIWLRATGYGEMYPILAYDENDEPFETEVNLSDLKTVNLSVEPESDGLFTYELPLSKKTVRFKMLTVGELENLEKLVEENKDNPINEEQTLILENQLVEIDGNKDRAYIKEFANSMRVGDAQGLRNYIAKIECGIDMNIDVRTPGGGSINMFLPITPRFFWPNARI
jgi:hypothetical protein